MRISDWSSDVCSSDLHDEDLRLGVQPRAIEDSIQFDLAGENHDFEAIISSRKRWNEPDEVTDGSTDWVIDWKLGGGVDRKSVVYGRRGSVRVDLVGRRILKKKNRKNRLFDQRKNSNR